MQLSNHYRIQTGQYFQPLEGSHRIILHWITLFFYDRLNLINTLRKLVISRNMVISLDKFCAKFAPIQNMVTIALILPNIFDKNIKCITALCICIAECLKYIVSITNIFQHVHLCFDLTKIICRNSYLHIISVSSAEMGSRPG